jgi:uncharacterized protein (TIGR01244 family)
MRLLRLSASVAVAPQILPEDVPDIVDAGFRVLINNRPDGEEQGQPRSAELQAAAEAAGIEYHYLPVTAMNFPGEGFGEMQRLMNDESRPVLAFCRSGTRCANLWVATREDNDRSAAEEYARGLGFDLSMVRV